MAVQTVIACPACDLLHRRRKLHAGTTARCTRCGTVLYRQKKVPPDRPLAFVVAGLVLFLIANCFPFLSLQIEGRTQETVLLTGIMALQHQGQIGLAGLVLLTGVVCPLLQLLGLTYALLPMRWGQVPPGMAMVYRWVCYIQPWSMMEIFLLGVLVAAVKLASTADVVPGVALYAFMILIFVLPAAMVAIDSDSIWERAPIQADR